jgi:hypothetical protein
MANTFELIASSTVTGSTAANIDFTSIPSTFTDLCLKFSIRSNGIYPVDNIAILLNTSTSSYTLRRLRGTGSAASSQTPPYTESAIATAAGATASTFSSGELYLPNYASSNNKSYSVDSVSENNGTEAYMYVTAGLWSNTAAITGIRLQIDGSNLITQYSTAYLYGVKNA